MEHYKKKILLINCAISIESREKIKEAVSSPNLGLMSIASVLKMHGYEVKMIDFFVERLTGKEFVEQMKSYEPDVIGFSVYTRTVPFLKRITAILRKINYKGIIIAGGPHPSFCEKEMLCEYGVDFVIKGEGEFTFVKIMESVCSSGAYPLQKIKGIAYKENGQIIVNEKNGYITKLDVLPLQPIGMIEKNKYSVPFSIITSRGCPGNCIYCSSRALAGNHYRMRSAENIICEIVFLSKKLESNTFVILDDTFTASTKRFMRFAELVKKEGNRFQFRIESRGDVLSDEILRELKEINCRIIHVGIESGSQRVIHKIGKNIDLSKTVELLKIGVQLKIHMVASFIIGHYCDTDSTIKETLSLMEKLSEQGIEVSVASCTPFPGTPLYENLEKLGMEVHAASWEDYDFGNVIISTEYLSQEKLRDYLFKAVEISMNQQKKY